MTAPHEWRKGQDTWDHDELKRLISFASCACGVELQRTQEIDPLYRCAKCGSDSVIAIQIGLSD